MDFKKTTRQHADRKYIQMLDGSTPPPYEGDVEIDASRTYSSKRDRYYNRLSQERSEFNSALSKVQSAESARLRSEEADLEKGAKARYKLFKMLKTIAFLLPIVLAVFTGINIFSNKTLYDMVTDAPFVFFWVVFALAMIVASVQLIRKLNQNEIYYNRNHIEGKVKYSALAIGVVVAVTAVGILFISLTSSILPKKDDFVFVNRNGEYYLTGYLGDKSVLVLPNEYEGNEYSIDEMAFYERNDITSVVITGGVKTIGYRAFQWCESIESIKIGEGVTHIQDYAFQYCKALKTLELPSSIEYIGNTVFGDDKLIETAIIPAMVANSISSGSLKTVVINGGTSLPENAFYKATSLENVTIADSVTTISSSAFNGCVAIKNLTCPAHVLTIIPKGSLQVVTITSGDTIPDNALLNAKSLVSVTIPNTITKIGKSAFDGCALLESITVPSGVTEIGEYAFSGCSSVKNIKIPDGITIINKGTFKNCSSLEAITIPESVTAIKGVAFYGCSKITSVVVPNKVTEMGHGVFGKCDALTSITVPFVGFTANPEEARWTTFGYIFGDASDDDRMSSGSSKLNTSNTSEYTYQNGYHFLIPESLKKVTITNQSIVRDYAFSYCDLIEEIIYEKTITSIGTQAFFNCKKLKAIPEFDVSTIANEAFYGCSSLKSITISDKVTSIGASAFGACSGLESLTVPFVGASNSETSASTTTLFGYFFGTSSYDGGIKTTQCYKSSYGSVYYYIPSSLKTVTVTGGKLFYGAFYNCSNLKKVTLGDKIDEIGEKVFYGCSSLEELTTPYIGKTLMASEGASSTTVLGYFFGTSSFTNATEVDQNFETYYIPNSLKKVNITKGTYVEVYGNDGDSYYPTTMSKILSHTFAGCTSLESVTLPDELEMIGNYAFNGCTGLTEITIPDSVTTIGDCAFYNNSAIKSITIGDAVTSIRSSAFYNCAALESISIPDSITSIGSQAFYGCSSLEYNEYENALYFGNDENPYVVLIKAKDGGITSCAISRDAKIIYSYAFEYCSSLTSITIPNNIISIGEYAFRNCTSLTIYCEVESKPSSWNSYWNYSNRPVVWGYGFAVVNGVMYSIKDNVATVVRQAGNIKEANIPESIEHDGVSYPVTSIENQAFYNCTALTSVTIPDSVTSIGNQAFYGCSSLTSITIPNSVTTIGYNAFNGSNIKNVTASLDVISNMPKSSLQTINITSGTTIENFAFQNCYNLISITLPDSITSIGASAFDGCSKLKSIEIPNSVSSISYTAFYGCNSLTDITVDESNQSYKSLNGILYNKNGSSILCYPAGKTATSFTIPSSVKTIGSSAFFGCRSLTSVTIPNSVTSIESAAFNNCSGITSLIIPNSVTTIDSSAFNNCSGITSITIPNSVTSIGNSAFQNCTSLASVNYLGTIEKWSGILFEGYSSNPLYYAKKLYLNGTPLTNLVIPNTVTEIKDYAFYNCTAITSVIIPDSVTSIGNSAFNGCTNIKTAKIPSLAVSLLPKISLTTVEITSGTSIGASAFSGCSKLTSVVIPDSVISIGLGAFSGCSSLESITIPFVGGSRKTSSNTYQYPLGYIFGTNSYTGGKATTQYFYGSSTSETTSLTFYIPLSLKSVTVTGGNILYGAFYNCVSLASVVIGDGVTIIGNSAFQNCTLLESVTIGNGVTSIGSSAFRNCTSITSVNYLGTIEKWSGISFDEYYSNPLYYAKKLYLNGKLITELVIPSTATEIKDYAFYNCTSITSVAIGDGVTKIGYSAFYRCDSLTSVTIPDSVTSIGNSAFSYCYNLVEVYNLSSLNIPVGFDNNGSAGRNAKVVHTSLDEPSILETVNGYIFMTWEGKYYLVGYAGNETALTLPDGYKGNNYEIYQYAFYERDDITKVTIPDSVTSIGYSAFYDCDSFTSIIIPNSVTSIGDAAFEFCRSLASITIPNSVTSIGNAAFECCRSLASITIPNSITSIGNSAFEGCTSLTSVTIPDSVTLIDNYAFYDCSSLTSITIPDSVTSIGNAAFWFCDSLTIYCEATSKPSGWDSSWNPSNCPVLWGQTGK